jgi:hypothetical protein
MGWLRRQLVMRTFEVTFQLKLDEVTDATLSIRDIEDDFRFRRTFKDETIELVSVKEID